MSSERVDRFSQLVHQHPDNVLFRFSLAQALEAAGRTDEARRQYETCCAAKPDWMMPRILLGKSLVAAGQTAAAREMLASALALAIAQDHEEPERELRGLLADLPVVDSERP